MQLGPRWRCRVVSLTREKLRRDRGGPEPRNNRNRGRSKTKQWAEPHTQIRRELATRNRLRQQDKYNAVRDYNRQDGKRLRANTHTHTETTCNGGSAGSTHAFHEAEQPSKSL